MESLILCFSAVLLVCVSLYFYLRMKRESADHGLQNTLSDDFTIPDEVLAKGKKILILAPHQDDEALMCSGIITHALANGADIKIGVITNGDKKGRKTGLKRIKETIKAMECLGVSSANIIFFGYGNTEKDGRSDMLRLYNAATDDTVVSSHVGTETYNLPGIPEYHYQKHGEHGLYNRTTLRQDLAAAIQEYNPDHIFAASLYDTHPDHSILYRFIVEAIIQVKRNHSEFSPVMHEYLVHVHEGDGHWPTRDRRNSPLLPFTKPAQLDSATLLEWEKREIFTLPLAMQKAKRSKNKKYAAISKYRSQRPAGNNNYLYSYVKRDEIFWRKNFSNIAFLASVSVSSENALTGQLGIKAIDGLVDGYPRFPAHEWVTQGETSGAWIQLSWPYTHNVNKIILHERPNPNDHITGATLIFSDGSKIKVGPLPSNGSGYEIHFPVKAIEWIKLNIDTAVGENIGLSEFEVYKALTIHDS